MEAQGISSNPTKMKCPECGNGEMLEGEFALKKPMSDWLFFGMGFSDLCFLRPGEKKRIVMQNGAIRRGYRCEKCKALVITSVSHPNHIP